MPGLVLLSVPDLQFRIKVLVFLTNMQDNPVSGRGLGELLGELPLRKLGVRVTYPENPEIYLPNTATRQDPTVRMLSTA